jgi:parvulin-like peptidyl-prolyl isomerase
MEIFYALQEGEISFIQAAQQYIEDKKLQRQSGYRGWLNRRQLLPEISAAVFEAHSPQILKPLVTSQGVHLILVSEILQPPLDESLRQKILSDLFNNWLSQQVAEANIIQQLNLDSSVITLPVGQTG